MLAAKATFSHLTVIRRAGFATYDGLTTHVQ